jgi:hypothetical protein
MDGDMDMGGLVIKGIQKKSDVGYLTHLEALRLCEVGSFYKVPKFPVWVVGSSSHFTVLFSFDSTVNEESTSEKMLSFAQRVFKSADVNECGYIPSSLLKQVLIDLNLNKITDNEIDLARLRGHLQIDGEIILWSNFWENVSKLMTGNSLDSIINLPSNTSTTLYD